MGSNGGVDDGAELQRMVEGLRTGDLSFVFALAVRFGSMIVAHPSIADGLAAQPTSRDRVVHEVVLALAELARSSAAGDRTAERLLADAIDRVRLAGGCHSPSA